MQPERPITDAIGSGLFGWFQAVSAITSGRVDVIDERPESPPSGSLSLGFEFRYAGLAEVSDTVAQVTGAAHQPFQIFG